MRAAIGETKGIAASPASRRDMRRWSLRELEKGADVLQELVGSSGADLLSSRPAGEPPPAPYVLRLDGVPATPASLARIRERVEEINRQFKQADVPFRLRLM